MIRFGLCFIFLAVPVLKENMETAELYIPKPNERQKFFLKGQKLGPDTSSAKIHN